MELVLADINVNDLVAALIYVVVVGLIVWVLWWFVGFVGLPEPFNKAARVIIGLVAVLCLINLLLTFTGHPVIVWR